MKKLIYVLFKKYFYVNDYTELGCDIIKNHGYQVEIWSMIHLTYPKTPKPDNIYIGDEVKYLFNNRDIRKNIKRVQDDDTVFIMYQGSFRTIFANSMRRMVSRANMKYCDMYMPHSLQIEIWNKVAYKYSNVQRKKAVYNTQKKMEEHAENIMKKFLRHGLAKSFSILFDKTNQHIQNKYNEYICKNYQPLYNFLSTKMEVDFVPRDVLKYSNDSINCFIHSWDYDHFLKNNDTNKNSEMILLPDEYIVFIDQGGDTHPDFVVLGIEAPCGNNYIEEINKTFAIIERQLKMEVIVALHPKANYKSQVFENRKVISGNTDVLIKEAKYVLIHFSTALSWITLWKKPFIILGNDSFLQIERYKRIFDLWAWFFNSEILNMTSIENQTKIEDYIIQDSEYFNEYISIFVKNENTPEKLYIQVVLDKIKDL